MSRRGPGRGKIRKMRSLGPASFLRSRTSGRASLRSRASVRASTLPALLALAACAATDVVATRPEVGCRAGDESLMDAGCPDVDAGADASSCRAATCSLLGSRSTLCQNAQPPVIAGDSCTGDSPAQISGFALCSCSDLLTQTQLTIDAFRGTLSQRAPAAAVLGINEDLELNGAGSLDGTVVVAGRSSVSSSFSLAAPLVRGSPPCNCAADALLDIGAAVRERSADNDNALAGLSSEQLNGFRGRQELVLECGRYLFSRMKGDEPVLIRTRGNVAIFVESNIELNESLSIQTEGDGQVSLFVAGDMRVAGSLSLTGDPLGSARVNLYLASTGTLEIDGSTEIIGALYAPRAELVTIGTFQLYGSLFVRRAAPAGAMYIHYDTLAASARSCPRLP